MPYKDPEKRRAKQKEYARRHYEKHRDKILAKSKKAKTDARQWWKEYKATLGCFGCEENDPDVIDFHHVIADKKNSDDSASVWATTNMRSRTRILRELWATCVPLCCNCHRKVHALHRQLTGESNEI